MSYILSLMTTRPMQYEAKLAINDGYGPVVINNVQTFELALFFINSVDI